MYHTHRRLRKILILEENLEAFPSEQIFTLLKKVLIHTLASVDGVCLVLELLM